MNGPNEEIIHKDMKKMLIGRTYGGGGVSSGRSGQTMSETSLKL